VQEPSRASRVVRSQSTASSPIGELRCHTQAPSPGGAFSYPWNQFDGAALISSQSTTSTPVGWTANTRNLGPVCVRRGFFTPRRAPRPSGVCLTCGSATAASAPAISLSACRWRKKSLRSNDLRLWAADQRLGGRGMQPAAIQTTADHSIRSRNLIAFRPPRAERRTRKFQA
jgi:hypothetical protein